MPQAADSADSEGVGAAPAQPQRSQYPDWLKKRAWQQAQGRPSVNFKPESDEKIELEADTLAYLQGKPANLHAPRVPAHARAKLVYVKPSGQGRGNTAAPGRSRDRAAYGLFLPRYGLVAANFVAGGERVQRCVTPGEFERSAGNNRSNWRQSIKLAKDTAAAAADEPVFSFLEAVYPTAYRALA